ncbi:MAG TPA: hypothetical protein VF516_27315 [Kofleriaceae bacterium]
MWQRLTSVHCKESYLQDLFDHWGQATCLRVGVPPWLRGFSGSNARRPRSAFGYQFTTDAEYEIGSRRYVIELKHAVKYEPLALAEVLHHAEWIRRYERDHTEVVPVIVTQFSCWLRLAIAALGRRMDGLGALRYYEVDVLGQDDPAVIWFDEPLAPWVPAERPPFLLEHPETARLHWHHVATTRTWFGLDEIVEERPLVLEVPYVTVSEIDHGGFVLWEGTAAPNGTPRSTHLRSRYYAWCPGGNAEARDGVRPSWGAGLAD